MTAEIIDSSVLINQLNNAVLIVIAAMGLIFGALVVLTVRFR